MHQKDEYNIITFEFNYEWSSEEEKREGNKPGYFSANHPGVSCYCNLNTTSAHIDNKI